MGLTARKAMISGLILLMSGLAWSAAEDAGPPGAGAAPGGAPQLPVAPFGGAPGGLPPLPGGPGGLPTTANPLGAPTDGTGATAEQGEIAPPPLSSLAMGLGDASTTGTTATLSAGPIETYEFLYREDEEMGVLRERYTSEEARQRREQEIGRLIAKYGQPQVIGAQPGQGGQPQGVDPRAAAEWDFYFEQLQLYAEYVRDKVLRTQDPEFQMPTYEATDAVRITEQLEETYRNAATTLSNDQWNENREFYERLESREDRRRNFLIWLRERERELQQLSDVWARKISGRTWTDGQPVSRDDWYYGQHFNGANPVQIRVGGQSFLFSREPQNMVPSTTLNVLSTNLTPYDVVDHHGNLKSPAVEAARGSLVRPLPMPPAAAAAAAGGAVELAAPAAGAPVEGDLTPQF